MAIRLTGRDIAVVPIEDPDRTEGGLWVPDQAKQRIDQGIIKYLGPDCQIGLRRGDHVIFGGYTGQKLSISDPETDTHELLYLLPETSVAAVVEGSTHRLVTEAEIFTFLEDVEAKLSTEDYNIDEEVLERVIENLEAKLNDFLREKGFEF